MKKSTILRLFLLGAALFLAMLVLQSGFAQPARPDSGVAAAKPVNQNAPNDRPPSMKENVQVMVELSDVPAAVPYAEAMKAARAQAEAERTAALANSTLKNPKKVEISAADNARIESHAQRLDHIQQGLLPSLTGGNVKGKVLFRTQHAYNGIAMIVNPKNLTAISQLPGIKAIHPMHPKYLSAAFSDIDFLRTRMPTGAPWGTASVHGEGIKVADIDTGLDYVHANFGGNANYTGVTDTNPNGHFPSAKVPGGTDLVGDAYNANDPNSVPVPDSNPMDCNGHGTGTASLIAGFGENNDGSTYTGPYDATNPNMANLKISPGFAPQALLYPVRVFGCNGSTNVVVEAIEWAMTNHMDVINMSLGSDEGYADDPDAVAASNAAATGIIVCSAAGNAGDSYYIHSSPASASGTLSVAATFNDQNGFISDATVTGNSANLSGQKFAAIYADSSPHTNATGDVVYAIPHDASTPLTNAAQVTGKIVLIDRGAVTFATKAANAQAAGAIGIIVANNAGDPAVQGSTGPLSVPDVMISTADGTTIKTAANFNATTGVPANPTNVTIAAGGIMITKSTNPPGSAAGAGSPDTVPSYTSRGPRLPDSAVKPDVAAPAEVVGVAASRTGTAAENFNGTSSATPHVAGTMALLKQLHPTWSVQELNALLCDTATHDLATRVQGTTKIGVGRIGAGRIDLTNAATANVVAFNGSDPSLLGVSFGVVETPVSGTTTLDKNITVENKGATNVTYNLTIQNNPLAPGATFTFPNGTSFTVNAHSTATIPVRFTATGSALRHSKEASVSFQLPVVVGRQWLTEAAGYAVFTPTDGSPTLRVAVYAAPKPVSAMHAGTTNFNIKKNAVASVSLPLAGTGVNTGSSYGFGFDILSLVKPFELQFARTGTFNDANKLKYVGLTSDFGVNGTTPEASVYTFGIEGFGDAAVPEFNSSDKEIVIDTDQDGTFDFQVFLTSIPNGTSHSNEYVPVVVNLHTNTATQVPFPYETNLLDPVFNPNGSVGGKDTNAFNSSAVLVPVPANMLILQARFGAPTKFNYVVVTFDRNGNQVDQTPLLTYDARHPGFIVQGGQTEPFYYSDLPGGTIPVQYNSKNFQSNGSLGVWLVHRHNADGQRSDVVTFTQQ
jgi:subtilisin family serine protease